MFSTGAQLLHITQEEGISIAQAMLQQEMQLNETDEAQTRRRLHKVLAVMEESSTTAANKKLPIIGNMISGDAMKLTHYRAQNAPLCGSFVASAMAKALSCSEVNASMGLICAAPTAGSCGILPGVLLAAQEEYDLDDAMLEDALLTAAAIGSIIAKNATLAGAEGGCQAECGSAAAMAAAALVHIKGGDARQCLDAAAIALKSVMGLVCDPVAGLVISPCAKRNASGVANAACSADMALAGIESVIPFDEVVHAMKKVGRMLPYELKETAKGGIATSPTALRIQKEIFGH